MKRTITLAVPAVLLLAAMLIGVLAVSPAQAHPSTFPDVSETNPAHDAIESLAGRGIVIGVAGGDFQPDGLLTRGQATKMLVAWRGAEPTSPASSFSDVDATYASYVETALAAGWVSGYPDGTFRPQGSLTRQQMATVTIRSLGLETAAQSLTTYEVDDALSRFADRTAISPEARPYLALAVKRSLFSGDAGRLYPLAPMTRAQFSLVLYRADALAAGPASDAGTETGAAAEVGEAQTALQEASHTPDQRALTAFMDAYLFQPHNSPVTGEMVLQNAEWYGVPPLSQLVIMAAETSLGDPKLGGALARRNNFGCMRYHGAGTPWGLLSDGRVWVAGKDWYSFATPALGMAAWGRYLKSAMDGFYLPILGSAQPDWDRFAAVYYGRRVSGFNSYVNRLQAIETRFRTMAAEQGVSF
ncbi:MAG: S-layer homology domain-containing protein [bacterium]